jgi:hypothetical protein
MKKGTILKSKTRNEYVMFSHVTEGDKKSFTGMCLQTDREPRTTIVPGKIIDFWNIKAFEPVSEPLILNKAKKYLAYTTMWSEGVVVAREDDLSFPIGYDAISGGVPTDRLAALKRLKSFNLVKETTSMLEAASLDSALYEREGIDQSEVSAYNAIRSHILNSSIDGK